jgi:enoyl-CoA hydratase
LTPHLRFVTLHPMNETIQLHYETDGTSKQKIAIITFNRPHVLNALNREAMQRFAVIVNDLHQDETVGVVILTGVNPQAFCSGGDLNELSQLTTEADALDFIALMGDALHQLENLPVPVIAAINGYALGGGSEVAMACDLRIVDQAVKMGFVQARLALTPGWGAGQRLLQAVGYAKAMELLLRAEPIGAEELFTLRLANQIAPTGRAFDVAQQFARRIIGWDADVVKGIKRLLRAGITQPYDQAHQTERNLFPPLWAAQPHLDAVETFLHNQRAKQTQPKG